VRRAVAVARVVLRLLPVVLLLVIAVPGSGVRPATLSLTKVEKAEGYDAGADVVWVLVLGADSLGLTDAIQLLGIDTRTGAAAAIGIPRDTYVDLGDGEMGKINAALNKGPDVASAVVEELVGIPPSYVLVSRGSGFVSMVDALGGVEVDSPLAFETDEGGVQVREGINSFDGRTALLFAQTRLFGDAPGPPDFIRSDNHQALLLGLLKRLHEQDDDRGFVESMALSAIEGIDTDDASPLDLYRLLNALTSVDPTLADGCILVGDEGEDAAGSQIINADEDLADRLGREAIDDATFESGCEPS
jgi:polyisoprenyl-teichoic acid--peptidoglycan teichoic acid transferase